MRPVSAPAVCAGPAVVRKALQLPFRPWSRTPRCRRRVPLPRIMRARPRRRVCARAREAAGAGLAAHAAAGRGRGSFTVIPASSFGAKDGTGCPCFARIVRRCARGRAGRAEGVPLPPAHAGGFSAPQPLLSAEKRNGGPGSALLSCLFYTIPLKIKLFLEQKENYGQFSPDHTFILLNRRDNISFPLRLTAGTRGIRPVFGLAGDERCVARSRVPGRVRARAQEMSRLAARSQTPHTVSIRARSRRIFSRRALTIFSDKPD